MSNPEPSPEELVKQAAELERAKEDAHTPIVVPAEWFVKAGMPAPHGVVGMCLHPFSSERRFALPRLEYFGTGNDESACMVVFLCILDSAEVDAARGEDGVRQFRFRMMKWADDIGLNWPILNPIATRLREIRDELFLRIEASQSKPDIKGGKGTATPNE